MRRFALGLVLGATLSGLRTGAGQTLFEFPFPSAGSAYGTRALGLVACALALVLARRLFEAQKQATVLLLAVALGYALQGLFVQPLRSAGGLWWPGAWFVCAPLSAWLLIRGSTSTPSPHDPGGGGAAELARRVALAACAAGTALALEGTARELRLLGASTSLDDTIFGSVFLALCFFGAIAFGRTLGQLGNAAQGRDWGRGRALEMSLALAAGLSLLSIRGLAGLATPTGLREFMRRYGQDSFDNGMFGYDGILAIAVWIAPAFALGAGLACARKAGEWASIALGAAAGLLFIPLRFANAASSPTGELGSSTLIREGVILAAAAGLLASLLRAQRRGRPEGSEGSGGPGGPPRLAVALICAAVAAAPFLIEPPEVVVGTPWTRRPSAPSFVFETGQGQISVSPGGMEVDIVAIAGTRVTPGLQEATADRNRILASMQLLAPDPSKPGFNVLLVGQLTPGRALTLSDLGASNIDRTASWHDAMPALEEHLFTRRGQSIPRGSILAPSEARAKLASYDLVIALATRSEAPLIPSIEAKSSDATQSDGPIIALWIDAGLGIHRRELDRPVLLDADGVTELSVGLLYGLELIPGQPVGHGDEQRVAFAPGEPLDRASAWRERFVRWARREELGDYLLTDRLARANPEGSAGKLAEGLAQHYRAQRRSSMFETPEQQIELSPQALQTLSAAYELEGPDRFGREVWMGLARTLVGQRRIELIYDHLEPLVERFAPWPALQLALAHADLESLDPQGAVERLEGLDRQGGQVEVEALKLRVRATSGLGDHAAAARDLRRLEVLVPSDWQRRELAIQTTLAGDPEGPNLLRVILLVDPDDQAVRELLEHGTIPAPSGEHDHDHDHLNHDH